MIHNNKQRLVILAVEFNEPKILSELLVCSSQEERRILLEAAMFRAVELGKSIEVLTMLFQKLGTISREVMELAVDNGMAYALNHLVDPKVIQNALNSSSIGKRVAYSNRYEGVE